MDRLLRRELLQLRQAAPLLGLGRGGAHHRPKHGDPPDVLALQARPRHPAPAAVPAGLARGERLALHRRGPPGRGDRHRPAAHGGAPRRAGAADTPELQAGAHRAARHGHDFPAVRGERGQDRHDALLSRLRSGGTRWAHRRGELQRNHSAADCEIQACDEECHRLLLRGRQRQAQVARVTRGQRGGLVATGKHRGRVRAQPSRCWLHGTSVEN
mmetsp:Transcript_110721/g.313241  ORF Transcript_110721/g.313241 Transcript_110721/m.313241 type:complete len:214 (-) Transcript_110721:190-831(-)